MRREGNGGLSTPRAICATQNKILEEGMQKISTVIASSTPLSACRKHSGGAMSSEAKQPQVTLTETSKMGGLSSADSQGYAPRFERMMDELWQALVAHWGHAFIARFGEDWVVEKTWQSEMRGLTKNQILAALEVCKYDERFVEWPPAARVFRAVAVKQAMRAGGADADTVWRNVCSYYATSRPAEAVWIIQHAEDWDALRKGTDAAEREFKRLWAEMLAFVAEGGRLPAPQMPAPKIEHKRERKAVDWGKVWAAMGVSA